MSCTLTFIFHLDGKTLALSRKNTALRSNMSNAANRRIRDRLSNDPEMKLGFIVYRCTYASDDDWNRFMRYLGTTVRATLVKAELGDVLDRLDWNVQEDINLEEASFEEVRRFVKPRTVKIVYN